MNKRVFYVLACCLFFYACQNGGTEYREAETENSTPAAATAYDSILAQKLGADEYGMKKYVLAILKKGPKRNQDSKTREKIEAAHLRNIIRLAKEKKLVFAGPVLDDSDLQGIFIFDVREISEAKALVQSDPAIQSGRLVMELYPWYGTAFLPELQELTKKIAKTRI